MSTNIDASQENLGERFFTTDRDPCDRDPCDSAKLGLKEDESEQKEHE